MAKIIFTIEVDQNFYPEEYPDDCITDQMRIDSDIQHYTEGGIMLDELIIDIQKIEAKVVGQ